jgi:hypothetical protein
MQVQRCSWTIDDRLTAASQKEGSEVARLGRWEFNEEVFEAV